MAHLSCCSLSLFLFLSLSLSHTHTHTLALSPSVFFLYPVSFTPCMKLYPSGQYLCKSASANGSCNSLLLIFVQVSCAVSSPGQPVVEQAYSIMTTVSTWPGQMLPAGIHLSISFILVSMANFNKFILNSN